MLTAKTSQRRGLLKLGHIPIWFGSGNIQYATQTRPTWIPGNVRAHETAIPRRLRRPSDGRKNSHHPMGVDRSTGSATASVMEWKSGERRISVGWPTTGLSSSSASVWANQFPAWSLKNGVCTIAHRGESSVETG